MHEDAADCYNPTKFRYIESMVQRACAQGDAVAAILADKAHTALLDYQQSMEETLQQGRALLQEIEVEFPDASPAAQALHQQGRIAQLEKLLARRRHPHDAGNDLTALTAVLNQQAASLEDDPDTTPLEDLLRIQETDVVNALGQEASPNNRLAVPKTQELKSARRFRNAQVKRNADKLVTQAVEEIPEGSGPLNSQRLAARSLAAMRDLSPHYLSRFVTYMDTLFWLEQTDKEKRR